MNKTLLTAAVAAMVLAGCSNEENCPAGYILEGTPIRVNTCVADMETRAGYDETNGPQRFYLNITNPKNTKYSYNAQMAYNSTTKAWEAFDAKDNTKSLTMCWAGDGNNVQVKAATFTAEEMASLGVAEDQSTTAGVESSDKLVMKSTTVPPSTDGINVKLEHLMAKVKVEVDLGKDDEYTQNPITDVTIGGTELQRACAVDTSAFTSITPSTVGDITAFVGTFQKTDKTTDPVTHAVARYEAIVVPQTVTAGNFKVSFKIGDKSYSWASGKDVELASNYQYTVQLKLNGGRLSLGDLSVGEWGSREDKEGGIVEEYIPTLTVTEAGQLDEAAITKALRGGTKLRIVGPLNAADVETLRGTNSTITYLDLTEVTGVSGQYNVNNISFGYTTLAGKLETIKLPETMTEIHNGAFSGCVALTSIVMPSNLEEIMYGAFMLCGSLKEITIPSKVTAIPEYCFGYCTELTKVTFEGAVGSIGHEAFSDCENLEYLYLEKCTTALPTLVTGAFEGVGGKIKVYLSETLSQNIENGTATPWSGDFEFTTRSQEGE